MNYKDLITSCENTLKVSQPMYSKTYDNFFSICKNYLVSRGYNITDGNIEIPENDQAFISLKNIAALCLANIVINEKEQKPSLQQSNYFGVDKDGVMSTIGAMSFLTLQQSAEGNIQVLKSRFPMRELDAVKLCLFMIIFYDLKLYELSAMIAAILYSGGSDGSNN